jgi:hypothetical protein
VEAERVRFAALQDDRVGPGVVADAAVGQVRFVLVGGVDRVAQGAAKVVEPAVGGVLGMLTTIVAAPAFPAPSASIAAATAATAVQRSPARPRRQLRPAVCAP